MYAAVGEPQQSLSLDSVAFYHSPCFSVTFPGLMNFLP